MFREKIKGKMNEAGISVKDLAAKTKINPSTISSFLVGNRAISNENLDTILDALELTLVPKSKFVYQGEKPQIDPGVQV
ncbi:helix-turn-helix domain-containing protein [Bacteroides acidifaciens]|uniref:helix-turn-helix domain-containing protein n=1 Tax=Bacteroides acidifaciens TaxID=85831 RepID=UPI00258CA22C|nr:helix-turn-helix transcriptional regulator [Bacteroides acidifaciens]